VLTIGITGIELRLHSMGKKDSISKNEKTLELRFGISIGVSVSVCKCENDHK
jgi:hypothetical protein